MRHCVISRTVDSGPADRCTRPDTVAAMPSPSVVDSRAALLEIWPDLTEVALVGLDLRDAQLDWSIARLESTMFLGCRLPDGESDRLVARGAGVLSALDHLPFRPFRSALYTYDELMAGHEAGAHATLDARIGAWFTESSTNVHDAVVRALHDATIDAAVARGVIGRRVVGVMGGHALGRDTDTYCEVA